MKKIILVILLLLCIYTPNVIGYSYERYNILGGTFEIDSCYGEGIGYYHYFGINNKIIVFYDFYRPFYRFYGFNGVNWVYVNSSDIGFILGLKGFAVINGYVDDLDNVVNIYGENIFNTFMIKK